MRIRCLSLVAGLLAAGAQAATQEPPEPPPLRLPSGVRARLWARGLGARSLAGTLVAADAGAVTLVPKGAAPLAAVELSVPAADVTRLELALERKRHGWEGLLIGAVAGVIVGFTDPVDPMLCRLNQNVSCSRAGAVGTYAVGFAAIGGVIGALVQTDRWTPVALDALSSPPPPAPRAGRAPLSLRLAVRF